MKYQFEIEEIIEIFGRQKVAQWLERGIKMDHRMEMHKHFTPMNYHHLPYEVRSQLMDARYEAGKLNIEVLPLTPRKKIKKKSLPTPPPFPSWTQEELLKKLKEL